MPYAFIALKVNLAPSAECRQGQIWDQTSLGMPLGSLAIYAQMCIFLARTDRDIDHDFTRHRHVTDMWSDVIENGLMGTETAIKHVIMRTNLVKPLAIYAQICIFLVCTDRGIDHDFTRHRHAIDTWPDVIGNDLIWTETASKHVLMRTNLVKPLAIYAQICIFLVRTDQDIDHDFTRHRHVTDTWSYVIGNGLIGTETAIKHVLMRTNLVKVWLFMHKYAYLSFVLIGTLTTTSHVIDMSLTRGRASLELA